MPGGKLTSATEAATGTCTIAVLAVCLLFDSMTEGMSLARMGTELRCQCIHTESRFIHPKHIQTVELIQSGAHCANVEVIATLKSGQEVCLEPSAKWVERIINRMLARGTKISVKDVSNKETGKGLYCMSTLKNSARRREQLAGTHKTWTTVDRPLPSLALTINTKFQTPAMKVAILEKRLTAASCGVPIKDGSRSRTEIWLANIFVLIIIILIT